MSELSRLAQDTRLLQRSRLRIDDTHKQAFTAFSVKLQELPIFAERWVRQVRKNDFSERLASAIVIFQEALSAVYEDIALIKLWTCIEMLCTKDDREPLSKAIDRASSIFKNSDAVRQRLNFIADRRHAAVHHGESGNHSLLCAQWASAYAAELIGFCAFNVHGLTKRSEVLDHLSTSRSPAYLRHVVKVNSLRLRMLVGRSKTSAGL